jgi:hypothetical protein
MDANDLFTVIGVVVFVLMLVVNLLLQRKVTRLESKLRAIRFEAEDALALIGKLDAGDEQAIEMLAALGEHAGDDELGQLFTEDK